MFINIIIAIVVISHEKKVACSSFFSVVMYRSNIKRYYCYMRRYKNAKINLES